jgi:amphi-Trp domain-containing protein
MGKETRLFKSEERKKRAEVAEFLNQIAEKLQSGKVLLRRGGDKLALEIPENLILEIQVEDEDKKSKGVQHSLEIEIKWYDDDSQSARLELG